MRGWVAVLLACSLGDAHGLRLERMIKDDYEKTAPLTSEGAANAVDGGNDVNGASGLRWHQLLGEGAKLIQEIIKGQNSNQNTASKNDAPATKAASNASFWAMPVCDSQPCCAQPLCDSQSCYARQECNYPTLPPQSPQCQSQCCPPQEPPCGCPSCPSQEPSCGRSQDLQCQSPCCPNQESQCCSSCCTWVIDDDCSSRAFPISCCPQEECQQQIIDCPACTLIPPIACGDCRDKPSCRPTGCSPCNPAPHPPCCRPRFISNPPFSVPMMWTCRGTMQAAFQIGHPKSLAAQSHCDSDHREWKKGEDNEDATCPQEDHQNGGKNSIHPAPDCCCGTTPLELYIDSLGSHLSSCSYNPCDQCEAQRYCDDDFVAFDWLRRQFTLAGTIYDDKFNPVPRCDETNIRAPFLFFPPSPQRFIPSSLSLGAEDGDFLSLLMEQWQVESISAIFKICNPDNFSQPGKSAGKWIVGSDLGVEEDFFNVVSDAYWRVNDVVTVNTTSQGTGGDFDFTADTLYQVVSSSPFITVANGSEGYQDFLSVLGLPPSGIRTFGSGQIHIYEIDCAKASSADLPNVNILIGSPNGIRERSPAVYTFTPKEYIIPMANPVACGCCDGCGNCRKKCALAFASTKSIGVTEDGDDIYGQQILGTTFLNKIGYSSFNIAAYDGGKIYSINFGV